MASFLKFFHTTLTRARITPRICILAAIPYQYNQINELINHFFGEMSIES
jgi:hypothetical protein